MHRRDGKLIVSATDLVGFLECGHLTNLDRALAEGLKAKPDVGDDPALDLLRRRGGEHEERYIREELTGKGRRVTNLLGNRDLSYAEQAGKTLDAMANGDDIIFQGTFFNGRWLGYPDFLLRVPGASKFGDYHYEVADTKLAHSAKASALIQICSYVDQIHQLQEVRPEHVYVVTGGAAIKVREFRTAEMMAYYRGAKSRFEDVLAGELDLASTYPDPVEHCAVCKWAYAECRPTWHRDDALPLVAGIGRAQRKTLQANSVITMTALSQLEPPIRFEGMKPGQSVSMLRMRDQARLQVETGNDPVPAFNLLPPDRDTANAVVADRGLNALPLPSPHDLFFDIEGDPFAFWEGLEYLFGIWDGSEYRGFWAMNRAEEKTEFEQVIDLFAERYRQHPEMHIYHYGVYEPSRLKQLAGRHATRQDELDKLLRGRVFVDLYRVVRQGVLVGAERYSIKNLEPLYGFRREIKLRDANSSIVEFEKILEVGDPGDVLKASISGYNKDDCVSTERLRDWLEARRPEAEARFEVTLPRPTPGEPESLSEDFTERVRLVRELTVRLTEHIDTDPAKQSEADKQTWLVAHLLEWHRREDKSTWWRYYDLMSKSDEELVDEPEPIGDMTYEGIVEGGGSTQSHDHRYSFPPQDQKVEAEWDAYDPQLPDAKKRTGKVQFIDGDAGIVDIRRKKAWTGPHPTSIVQRNIIDPKDQRESIFRLGEWVADHGIDSPDPDWRAARDLLRRRPPRLASGEIGGLVREGETGTDAARRLAVQLDGTTLAVQGPPGSGKTYTGARMILDLVSAGKKVGVTSNSHKVISNLVEALLDAAREERVTLRVIQKAKDGEAYQDPAVRRVEDNGDVADALNTGDIDVAAGTPWLWADPDMANTVDTLFVDEAGQVSLANVAAMSVAARNVVLLGDPQQLDQPTQGVHPDGAGRSALGHYLGEHKTIPEDRGVFLERTYRMHPAITSYTSDLFYEGKLTSVEGLERQRILGEGEWAGSGLRWVGVAHDGNTNASPEEAEKVVEIVRSLVGRDWINQKGERRAVSPDDIRVMSPFNAHRLLIDELLAKAGIAGVPVGTVDKFQGQEAAVSIYTMATSRPEDAPRGMAFLYSLNRLNVATSRARALAIVVASPRLLRALPTTPDQLRMANGLSAFEEAARPSSPLTDVPPTDEGPVQLAMQLG